MSNPDTPINVWKKCSICKNAIFYNSTYYLCNISTCQNERTGMRFCSSTCWDAHLGYVTHRSETYAIEKRSPTLDTINISKESTERMSIRKIVVEQNIDTQKPIALQSNTIQTDCLVVVSKVKKLISEQSSFNTSQCCIDRLTKKVIEECLKGIKKAELAGRKTVMGRDIE